MRLFLAIAAVAATLIFIPVAYSAEQLVPLNAPEGGGNVIYKIESGVYKVAKDDLFDMQITTSPSLCTILIEQLRQTDFAAYNDSFTGMNPSHLKYDFGEGESVSFGEYFRATFPDTYQELEIVQATLLPGSGHFTQCVSMQFVTIGKSKLIPPTN